MISTGGLIGSGLNRNSARGTASFAAISRQAAGQSKRAQKHSSARTYSAKNPLTGPRESQTHEPNKKLGRVSMKHGGNKKELAMGLSFLKPGLQKTGSVHQTAFNSEEEEPNSLPWFPDESNFAKTIFYTFEEPELSRVGKIVASFVMLLIVVSTLSFILETEPSLRSVQPE
jgi:hypothetical protein